MWNKTVVLTILAFGLDVLGPLPAVQGQLASPSGGEFVLPAPGTMVALSPAYNPPLLKGLKVHPDNPFRFDFILDQGDSALPTRGHVPLSRDVSPRSSSRTLAVARTLPNESAAESESTPGKSPNDLKQEANKLIKYFLASLTIPEKDLWVNLSPYEKNRIIPDAFGKTEMGRDLLAEDYMLKQITSSLIYPEGETGKKFWKKVYAEAAKRFGTTNIPVNTFNKVWIVPEKAVVYENAKAGTAYVVESKLKVMLEEDYLSKAKHGDVGVLPSGISVSQNGDSPPVNNDKGTVPILKAPNIRVMGSQMIREIVIPELTKEVNTGANFAKLRQVYNSLILATWYKKKIKDSILTAVYANKNKIQGITITTPGVVEVIYQRYLQAFKKGVYNFIKEETDSVSQQPVPRKYFSGGVDINPSQAMVSTAIVPSMAHALDVKVDMDPAMSPLHHQAPDLDRAMPARRQLLVSMELSGFPQEKSQRLLARGVTQAVITDYPFSGRLLNWVISGKEKTWGNFDKRVWHAPDPLDLKGLEAFPIIMTVANNFRTWEDIEHRLEIAMGMATEGVLVLSGGGFYQRYFGGVNPAVYGRPVSSFDSFPLARNMARARNYNKPIFMAWDPNDRGDFARLQEKIALGATDILTQPPFFWDEFMDELHAIQEANLRVRFFIGVPVFSSAQDVQFWLEKLLRIHWRRYPRLVQLVKTAEMAERDSPSCFADFRKQWSIDLIEKIQTRTYAQGIHFFPSRQYTAVEEIMSRTGLLKAPDEPPQKAMTDFDRELNRLIAAASIAHINGSRGLLTVTTPPLTAEAVRLIYHQIGGSMNMYGLEKDPGYRVSTDEWLLSTLFDLPPDILELELAKLKKFGPSDSDEMVGILEYTLKRIARFTSDESYHDSSMRAASAQVKEDKAVVSLSRRAMVYFSKEKERLIAGLQIARFEEPRTSSLRQQTLLSLEVGNLNGSTILRIFDGLKGFRRMYGANGRDPQSKLLTFVIDKPYDIVKKQLKGLNHYPWGVGDNDQVRTIVDHVAWATCFPVDYQVLSALSRPVIAFVRDERLSKRYSVQFSVMEDPDVIKMVEDGLKDEGIREVGTHQDDRGYFVQGFIHLSYLVLDHEGAILNRIDGIMVEGLSVKDFKFEEGISPAMISPSKHEGGIDLTSVKVGGINQGIQFHLDPAMLNQLQDVSGFVPVLVQIEPIADLHRFLVNPSP